MYQCIQCECDFNTMRLDMIIAQKCQPCYKIHQSAITCRIDRQQESKVSEITTELTTPTTKNNCIPGSISSKTQIMYPEYGIPATIEDSKISESATILNTSTCQLEFSPNSDASNTQICLIPKDFDIETNPSTLIVHDHTTKTATDIGSDYITVNFDCFNTTKKKKMSVAVFGMHRTIIEDKSTDSDCSNDIQNGEIGVEVFENFEYFKKGNIALELFGRSDTTVGEIKYAASSDCSNDNPETETATEVLETRVTHLEEAKSIHHGCPVDIQEREIAVELLKTYYAKVDELKNMDATISKKFKARETTVIEEINDVFGEETFDRSQDEIRTYGENGEDKFYEHGSSPVEVWMEQSDCGSSSSPDHKSSSDSEYEAPVFPDLYRDSNRGRLQYCDSYLRYVSFEEIGKTQEGKKPYRCKLCNLTFFSRSHCKNHRKAHSGEKLYSGLILQSYT